jgi:hypothetical protein
MPVFLEMFLRESFTFSSSSCILLTVKVMTELPVVPEDCINRDNITKLGHTFKDCTYSI